MAKKRRSLPAAVPFATLTIAAVALSGCRPEEPREADDIPAVTEDTAPPGMTRDMADMHMDPAAMRRQAEQMDSAVVEMRQHVTAVRQAPPERWHEMMEEHGRRVSGMLGMMDRHLREMDMGMGMSDEQMGRMRGMSGEEHRSMVSEMETLRGEVDQLRTASEDEVRERLPEHLDRLERILSHMEEGARHMRGR